MAEQKPHRIEIHPTFLKQGMRASMWILTDEKNLCHSAQAGERANRYELYWK